MLQRQRIFLVMISRKSMYDLIDVVHQTAKDERGPEEAKNVLRLFVCD